MADILPNAEKLGELGQTGGWQQQMARRRYQGGTLRKRGRRNPVWELQWREDYIKTDGSIGRRLATRKIGIVRDLTRRQAQKLADELLRDLNQGNSRPQSTMTLAHFVEMYFVPNFFPMLKLSTQKRYRRTFDNHVLPAFGQQRLCDIGTLDIQQFVLAKLRTGLGWACADHYRNLLSKIFAIATKWGYFSGANPASGVQLPEKTPVREKHVLTPDQAMRLLNVLNEPARTMVHLALLTGLRIGEILGLPLENVDFAVGEIRIAQAYYRGSLGTPKTKTSKRIVPLPSALCGPLLLLKERSKQSTGLVFQTGNGTPFNDSNLLHRNLKPAGKRLGIPWLNWHSLRRTHATYFQVVGGSLRDAQAQLGHSKMSTTLEVYTIPIAAHQREAVEKISGLMANDGKFAQNPEGLPFASQQIQ